MSAGHEIHGCPVCMAVVPAQCLLLCMNLLPIGHLHSIVPAELHNRVHGSAYAWQDTNQKQHAKLLPSCSAVVIAASGTAAFAGGPYHVLQEAFVHVVVRIRLPPPEHLFPRRQCSIAELLILLHTCCSCTCCCSLEAQHDRWSGICVGTFLPMLFFRMPAAHRAMIASLTRA